MTFPSLFWWNFSARLHSLHAWPLRCTRMFPANIKREDNPHPQIIDAASRRDPAEGRPLDHPPHHGYPPFHSPRAAETSPREPAVAWRRAVAAMPLHTTLESLDPAQRALLVELRSKFPDVPEKDALRFLVARKFELSKAAAFLQADVDWRKSYAPSEVTQARLPRALPFATRAAVWLLAQPGDHAVRRLERGRRLGPVVAVVARPVRRESPPFEHVSTHLRSGRSRVCTALLRCPSTCRCWSTLWRSSRRRASSSSSCSTWMAGGSATASTCARCTPTSRRCRRACSHQPTRPPTASEARRPRGSGRRAASGPSAERMHAQARLRRRSGTCPLAPAQSR